jgi:hypothetical protein
VKNYWEDPERKAAAVAKRLATRHANKIAWQKAEGERREQLELEKDELGREILRLRALYTEMQDQAPLREVCVKMTGKTLHTETEIVAVSEPYKIMCGVYFLVSNDRVVYVGQSVNIPARVAQHKTSGKTFDRVAFVECEKEWLNVLESLYIHVLRPSLNGDSNTKGLKASPLSMQDMLRYIGPAYNFARGIQKVDS